MAFATGEPLHFSKTPISGRKDTCSRGLLEATEFCVDFLHFGTSVADGCFGSLLLGERQLS